MTQNMAAMIMVEENIWVIWIILGVAGICLILAFLIKYFNKSEGEFNKSEGELFRKNETKKRK